MAYKHGVYVSEQATALLPTVEVAAGIPFIVGTAPVGMADESNVNRPVLCYSYAEAVAAFGYVPPALDAESGMEKFEYSISEFIKSQFSLFGVAPVIIVNVLDPKTHKKSATTQNVTLDFITGSATVAESGIIASTVTLTPSEGEPYARGEDFELTYDDDGRLVITSLSDDGVFRCETGTVITFSAEKTDPSMIDSEDIVGGVDVSGNKSGFELVNDCFPRFRLVPGILIAPGHSSDPEVAAVMAAKASNINELFKAISIVDAPADTVKQYSGVAAWKNQNNVTDPYQICCWPMLSMDGTLYHMSTQLAGLLGQVDSENDDVPYVSPSNKNFQMTATVLEDGTEVWLTPENASYLNGEGVVTALNFIGGWKCWGNRTACYPAVTDPKDAFIPLRRMFSWIGNTLVQTYWQRVDFPLNRRQVDTIVDSVNIWLNGLAARQYILGGRIEFNSEENSTTDLMDGIARFHVYVTPPSPNREIDFVLEYDADYLSALFA